MPEPKQILHVEDSDSDAKLIAIELRRLWRETRCERVQNAAALERALGQGPWDIILCDWSMPEITAFQVLEIIARRGLDLPVIIVSGTIGEEAAVAAMRGGARDYVLKDKLARLGPVIERELHEREERQARRKAEEALRAAEARYKRIVETTTQGILWIDASSKLTFVNARLGALLGYAPSELIGRSFLELMDEESRTAVERSIGKLSAGPDAGASAERKLIRKDGTRLWVHSEWTSIFDEAGRYEGRLAMFTDITELKRMDDALRVSEARLARLAETGVMGVLIADTAGAVVEANPTALKMLGFTREEVAAGGVSWIKLTPPEWLHVNEEIVDSIRRTGHAAPREKEYFRKDGTRVPVLVGVAAIDAPYAIAILIELTEQKRAERALRASESRFARLLESGLIGIAFADVLGNLHEVNDAYLAILGYQRDDPGAKSWANATPPEWLPADVRAVEQLKKTGIAAPWEKELFGKDGRRVPVLIGVAMLDETNCIAFITDLSDRKQAESVLRRTEEQLRQAQKMEAIGILAGGVAHDFNNILSVILSYSELLLEELPADEELRSSVEQIKLAGERASGLTRQLLAFSRQQIVAPKIVDLNQIVAHLDKLLRRLIREDIELRTLPEKDLGRCKCDPGQIEQVLMNLVVNARDAMPEGGRLTLETGNVELDEGYAADHLGTRPGRYVMLAVSDTGIGMDKATQARIYEPFFTTKGVGKGTGLGLSTVFGIVEQSQGSIWVYSELGRGTTFKIYLPRTDDPQQAIDANRPASALTGTETVLLVEDEEQIRTVACAVLQRAGYQVLAARNGAEALVASEAHPGAIHLLLTDVVMPAMNGKHLADRLRAVRPAIKVLFMSGYTDGTLVGELAAGAAFLQKPLTPTMLTRKVRETLDSAPPQ